jgi:hypothetical protein
MRNYRIGFGLVTALLVASVTACSGPSAGSVSSPSSVTPQIRKPQGQVPPTVNAYNSYALADEGVTETYSGAGCWTPRSASIPSFESVTFTAVADVCSGATLTANATGLESTECQLIWLPDSVGILVVNYSRTDCTWTVTGTNEGKFDYVVLPPGARKHTK